MLGVVSRSLNVGHVKREVERWVYTAGGGGLDVVSLWWMVGVGTWKLDVGEVKWKSTGGGRELEVGDWMAVACGDC